MSAGPVPASAARLIDAAALVRIGSRMQGAPEPPWLHAEAGRRMAERLPIIRLQPARVLDWYSFNGASSDVLRKVYPKAEHLRLEPPVQPGRVASRSPRPGAGAAAWWSPQRWLHTAPATLDEAQLQPASADLVWANMALHFSANPQHTFSHWHRALAVDGFLMFSTLGPGSLGALKALYAAAGWPPPLAPFVDMHDLGDMLVEAGFADPVMDQETLTLTWPTPQAAVDELRQIGGNAHPQRLQGLRTPRWRQRLLEQLGHTAGPDGRIALTFEVVYGHAFKPLPRVRLAPSSQVSLDDLRVMAKSGSRRR